jgi:hypothetical protein
MDIDNAGKGKNTPLCNICGGKGHFAKVCPSKGMSGYGAEVKEEKEEEVESESENESA